MPINLKILLAIYGGIAQWIHVADRVVVDKGVEAVGVGVADGVAGQEATVHRVILAVAEVVQSRFFVETSSLE